MRVSDPEYFIFTVNPDECSGVPEPVRERESYGDCWARDPGDGGEYGGGGFVL